MATNFPTSLDTLTNPTASDSLTSPSHAGQHADANDAIEALQAKVGVNSSAVTTSLDYKVSRLGPTICTSTTRPSSPFNGQVIYETDTGFTLLYRSTEWVLPYEQYYSRSTLTNSTTKIITVSDIPQYGKSLRFFGLVRSQRNYSTNTGGRFRVNGMTAAGDYKFQVGGTSYSSETWGYMGQIPDLGAPSNEFAIYSGFIPQYSVNTNSLKMVQAGSASYSGSSSTILGHIVGTTTGITTVTSISILDDIADNLTSGSFLEVWIGP